MTKQPATASAGPEAAQATNTTLGRVDLMPFEAMLCASLSRFFSFKAHSFFFPHPEENQDRQPEYLPDEEKLFVPLKNAEGYLLGVFVARGVPPEEAGAVLPLLPALTLTCLENLQLYKQSRIEPVSGLLNRRNFLYAMAQELEGLRSVLEESPGKADSNSARVSRRSGQFSLMAIRLGGLAMVVREEGYVRTDTLVGVLGEALKEMAPQVALPGRSGDYEFALLLPGCSLQACEELGAKIATRLAQAHIKNPLTGQKIRISPAVGFINCPRDLDGLERQESAEQARQLLRRARLAAAIAGMNARPELPPEVVSGAKLSQPETPSPVMAYSHILRKGGRVLSLRPLSRLVVSLGRTAGARPGQLFTVWGYTLDERTLKRRYKADIMLIEVYEGEALAEIIHSDDASFPPEAGDFLLLGIAQENSRRSAFYPDDQPEVQNKLDDTAEAMQSGTSDSVGVDFLPRWSLMREKHDSFAMILGRFSLLQPESGSSKPDAQIETATEDSLGSRWESLIIQALQKSRTALGPEVLAGRFALNSLIFFLPNPVLANPDRKSLGEALQELGQELATNLGLDSAFGIAPHPFLDFHKADSLENAKKALEYAQLLPKPHIGLLDSLALNISADRKSSLGDQLGAIQEYRQALLCAPDNILAWNSLGVVLAGLGQYKEARESLEEALSRVPDDHNTLYNLGNLQQSRRDFAGAQDFYLRCLGLEPENVFTLYRLGQLAEQQEKFGEAEEYYCKAAGFPGGAAMTRRSLARLSISQGRIEEAREDLHEALVQNPYDALAMQILAGLYLDAGEDPAVAESLARQSATLRPDLRSAWLELARALEAGGKKDAAREALIRAGEL